MGNNRVFPINKNKEADKALVLEAIEKEKIFYPLSSKALYYASDELKNDREIVLTA